MPQDQISMGPEAVLQIENQTFVWTGGNVSLNYKEHDTNDSSDAVNDQFRGGRRRLMIEGNAHSEKGRNIHAGPFNIGNEEFVDVKVYPNGTDGGEEPYWAPKWLRSNIRVEMPVKQGDPVTVALTGGSSGEIFIPGDL